MYDWKKRNKYGSQAATHSYKQCIQHIYEDIYIRSPKLSAASPRESVSVNDQPAGSMCQASCISYAFITTASTNLAETL